VRDGDVEEIEVVKEGKDGDGEGDEGRRRYLNEDGDIEINNITCVLRRHGRNLALQIKFLRFVLVRWAKTKGTGSIGEPSVLTIYKIDLPVRCASPYDMEIA
jgi:hypothetical protein